MTGRPADAIPEPPANEAATHVCAFEPCGCPVERAAEFCAPTCTMKIGDKAEPCKCGHAECKATQGRG